MIFKNNLYFKVKSQKIRLLRILMMLVRLLMLTDRTSEEVASEKLNSAEEFFEDFIEDVHDFGNYDGTADDLKEYDEDSTLRDSAEDGVDLFWGGGKIVLMMALRMI